MGKESRSRTHLQVQGQGPWQENRGMMRNRRLRWSQPFLGMAGECTQSYQTDFPREGKMGLQEEDSEISKTHSAPYIQWK